MITKSLDDGNHRVIGRMMSDPDGWENRSRHNVLQKKVPVFFGLFTRWVDIDHEKVPHHVEISMGCFGDTGGWRSKFADQMSF